MDTTDDKVQKLQQAYDEFMTQVRALEHEKTTIMRQVIGDMEREEIERILNDLKQP